MIYWPISIAGVNADEDIFGKYRVSLCDNTVWSKPYKVSSTYINITEKLVKRYQSVILSDDFIFFNGRGYFWMVCLRLSY